MSKTQPKIHPEEPASPAEENLKVAEGATAHGVEEQGQGQLEAEDFYSENHFVDEPDERNLK